MPSLDMSLPDKAAPDASASTEAASPEDGSSGVTGAPLTASTPSTDG